MLNESKKLYPCHSLAAAQLSLPVQAEKETWGGGGVLSTIYNGRFEKTVTFSFWMAFKAQT